MNRILTMRRIFQILFIFLIISKTQANTRMISGVVKNFHTDIPIVGANIYNKALNLGTTSDANGNFFFERPIEKEFKIIISHIAYEDLEIKVTDEINILVLMRDIFLQFNDIVVTGTKCEYALSDSPIISEVINNQQIERSGAMNLSELLQSNLGMSMNYDTHGPLDYNIHGLGSKYILILRDGAPIAGKFQDKVDLNQILLSRVDKIEIVKGPGSAIYGSDAMGGVINIITSKELKNNNYSINYRKTFFDNNNIDLDNSHSGDVYSARFGRKLNNISLQSSINYTNFTNYDIIEPHDHSIISQQNIDIGASWPSPKRSNELDINFYYFTENVKDHDYLASGIELSQNATKITRREASIKLKTNLNKNLIVNNIISSSNYNREFRQKGLDSTFAMYNLSKQNIFDYELNLNFNHSVNAFIIGYEMTKPYHENGRLNDSVKTLLSKGLFLQNDYKFSDNHTILFGIRWDRYDDVNVYSPRIAFLKNINQKFTLRSSYGKGYKTPSVTERFMDFHNVSQGYKVTGNKNLLPEESVGLSFNLGYQNIRNLKLDVTFYHNNFKNKILTKRVSDNTESLAIFQYENISRAQYSGIEIFTSHIINGSSTLKSNFNIRQNIDGEGNHLDDSVPLSFGVTINRRSKLLGSDINIKYLSNKRQITNNYFNIVDIVVTKDINQYLKLKFAIKNITNHTDRYYGPYIGRSIFLEGMFNRN